MLRVWLTMDVSGKPEPAGSKNAFVPLNRKTREPFRRPNGGVVVSVIDNNPKAKGWQAAVADAATAAMAGREPTSGAVSVVLTFRVARPKGHFGSGKNEEVLKGSAPKWPVSKPDVLKLARAVEDALTGIVYVDDSQIVVETLRKEYGDPGVYVAVHRLA